MVLYCVGVLICYCVLLLVNVVDVVIVKANSIVCNVVFGEEILLWFVAHFVTFTCCMLFLLFLYGCVLM